MLCGETSRCTTWRGLPREVGELVGVVEPAQRIDQDVEVQLQRDRAAIVLQEGRERLPLEVLHHDGGHPRALHDGDRLDDVGVVEADGEARLVDEHAPQIVVVGEAGLDDLEDDELVDALRAALHGEEDPRRPAFAELEEEMVLLRRRGAGYRPRADSPFAGSSITDSPLTHTRLTDAPVADSSLEGACR